MADNDSELVVNGQWSMVDGSRTDDQKQMADGGPSSVVGGQVANDGQETDGQPDAADGRLSSVVGGQAAAANGGQAIEDAQRVEALLARLGLAQHADAYPRDLSAGERQRVALAAITITEPRVLLLDEPTRGLDARAKRELAVLLGEWRAAGAALLVVTHDVEFAASIADYALVLVQGEVIAHGSALEILGSSPLWAPQTARLFPGFLTPESVIDKR